jgi:membrane fusion protein (multidrug efflux system)
MSHYEPPPVTISSTQTISKTWQSYLTAVGSLTAINGVDLSAEISGTVAEIRFTSGQYVKQGDVLIVLDTSTEQAALKDNQAKLKLAQINYEREKALFTRKVTSEAALDTRFAELQEAEAGVESTESQIDKKTITAPFAGKAGIRQVDLGQYVSPGTAMVTLQSLDPLYVMFSLPEQTLPNLHLNQPITVDINVGNGKKVAGKITAINSKVDQATRNILLQATIPNTQLELYPGMFALVKVWLTERKNTIVVPQTAISYSLSGDYVFLIKDESPKDADAEDKILRVYRQYVKVGERRGNEVAILDGLKTGDIIVTSGQLKLQNGTRVVINNNVEL